VERLAFPADPESAIVVVPAVRAFNDPAARSAAHAADQRRFSSSADVWYDTSLSSFPLAVVVVISLVQTKMLGAARSTWCVHEHGIESRSHHPLVVDVRPRERDSNGDTSSVGQNVTFGPAFSAIGGIRPREVPPFGAFTMAPSREAHSQSMPRSTW
jgi:hypothetical protein